VLRCREPEARARGPRLSGSVILVSRKYNTGQDDAACTCTIEPLEALEVCDIDEGGAGWEWRRGGGARGGMAVIPSSVETRVDPNHSHHARWTGN
jgi:hypothetical protein